MKKYIRIISFLLFCMVSINSFSEEEYERSISKTEWIMEMVNCKESMYFLENTEIYDDFITDTTEYIIQAEVGLQNCKFGGENNININKLHFKKSFAIFKCKGWILNMFQCRFKEGFVMAVCDFSYLDFTECNIESSAEICDFKTGVLQFNNCEFKIDSHFVERNSGLINKMENHNTLLKVIQLNEEINKFIIQDCKIKSINTIPIVSFLLGNYNKIKFMNTDFANTIINIEECNVRNSFDVKQCKFENPFGMNGFSFPENGTNFHWNQLQDHGICIWDEQSYDSIPYIANNDSQLADLHKYNELVSYYKRLFSSYKKNGDMQSANKCFIRMKDIETDRFDYLNRTEPSIKNYFNLRLNQFLRFFCEYGTSPIRSLIISMWIILCFAVLYFFSYSDWDKINREFLIRKYSKLLSYLRSEKKLEDFYLEKHKTAFKSFDEFKEYLNQSKKEIPFFIRILGRPLFRLSQFKYKLVTFIYRKFEILSPRWTDLKRFKKILSGTIISIAVIFYLIFILIVRSINSLFLSVNTFSTLGFGAIPVRGVVRYFAILEGFIGWFLLSLFSVSLISQLLQS